MTIPDDDEFEASFDDFDFEDDFEDVWDDDASQADDEAPPVKDELSDEPAVKDNKTVEAAPSQPAKPSSNRFYILPLLAVTVLGAGGYYAYANFGRTSPTIPVVQILSEPDLSLKNTQEKAPMREDLSPSSFETDNVEASSSPSVLYTENTIEAETTNTFQDDVLTPLPKNIENLDIELDPLIAEPTEIDPITSSIEDNKIHDQDEDLSNQLNNDKSDNISTSFDEQKMLEKTELSPSDDDVENAGSNPDIFDQIESLRDSRDVSQASTTEALNDNKELSTENTAEPLPEDSLALPVDPKTSEEISIEKVTGPKDIASKRKPLIEEPIPALEQANPPPAARPKKNWKIKAVQPGKAVIRDPASGAIKSVEVGQSVYEIGRIKEITKKSGKWVIVGELGLISQ